MRPTSRSNENAKQAEDGKIVVLHKEAATTVTQLRLARIKQLQAQITLYDELSAKDQQELRKQWKELRREILRGVAVEPGPHVAFLKGRRKTLIVK